MRLAVSIVGIIALAACDQAPPSEETPEVVAETNVMQPGLYSVGDETTVYGTTRLNEDGTYVDFGESDEIVGGGTWRIEAETLCFDPKGDGEEEQERCWINEPASEDGSFVTSRVDGSQSYVVTPIAEHNSEPGGPAE